MHIQKEKNKLRLTIFIPLIVALPSIVIGSIAMYFHKIHMITYGQNIACLIIAGTISCFVISRTAKEENRNVAGIAILIGVVLLLLTLFDLGSQGVHRWVSVGPIKFYISSIVLPGIIIGLWIMLQNKNWWITAVITVFITLF